MTSPPLCDYGAGEPALERPEDNSELNKRRSPHILMLFHPLLFLSLPTVMAGWKLPRDRLTEEDKTILV